MTPTRVLLVDDDSMVRQVLEVAIEMWLGAGIRVAHDGHAAVKALGESTFDLVITDLRIPGPDGLHIAETLRRDSPATKVVVITGRAAPSDEARIAACGAHLLRKPFGFDELGKFLQDLIES